MLRRSVLTLKRMSRCNAGDGGQVFALSRLPAWDGSSVWDLPIDSVAQAPTIEQMQQYEKAKSAKVEHIHFSHCG